MIGWSKPRRDLGARAGTAASISAKSAAMAGLLTKANCPVLNTSTPPSANRCASSGEWVSSENHLLSMLVPLQCSALT